MREGRWRRAAIRVIVFALLACLLCPLALAEDQMIDPAYPVPQYVHWLLDVARGELGYQEGSRGYTKYGEWSGDPYAEWCAEFLCWCVDQVDQQHGTSLLRSVYPMYSSQNTGRNWFIREGRYIARTGFVDGWGSQWLIGQEESMASGSYVPAAGRLGVLLCGWYQHLACGPGGILHAGCAGRYHRPCDRGQHA